FNMSASYAPTKNINIYAKVNNLFDKMYSERTHVIYATGRPGDWYSMPGRSFVLGMQVTF
ncbi:TonB-dependent receptor, partial [Phascolarctobacterium succinatutens]